MSVHELNTRHLLDVSILYFRMKKPAAKAHWLLSNTYDNDTVSEIMCRDWFNSLTNGRYNIKDRNCAVRREVSEGTELESLAYEHSFENQNYFSGSLRVTPQPISKRVKVIDMTQEQPN